MDPKNRRPSAAQSVTQRQKGADDFRPVVAHVKTAPSAHNVKPISARPIHGPQMSVDKPQVLQTKKAANQQPTIVAHSKHKPVAPPAYRPQVGPQGVQRKASGNRLTSVKTVPVMPGIKHQVIQRAAAYYADWHCANCNENFSYGYPGAQPGWPCEQGHTNWAPGAVQVAAQPAAAAAVAVAVVPPRQHELLEILKGKELVTNQQALVSTYYPAGKNKKHMAHGASADKQFTMREELSNFLNAILRGGDQAGYEAARKAINADFGTKF